MCPSFRNPYDCVSHVSHTFEKHVWYIYMYVSHTWHRRDVMCLVNTYEWMSHVTLMTWHDSSLIAHIHIAHSHITHTHHMTYHTPCLVAHTHHMTHHAYTSLTHTSHIHITCLITHTTHTSNTYHTHKCFSHESHTCDFFKHTATHTATHTAIHTHECFSHVPHTWHIRIHYVARLLWRASYAYVYLFAKEPLIIRLFCGKRPMKIRHPMTLRHPACHVRHMPMGWLRLVGSLKW